MHIQMRVCMKAALRRIGVEGDFLITVFLYSKKAAPINPSLNSGV
ncbi:hypothetical protein GS393_05051 [Pseudomonas savastanoi pv. phaseolicola]|nr:hypothetical protein [Pseudomonas savastanoi pv. phaseolicola]